MKNLFTVLTVAAFLVAFSTSEANAQWDPANPGGVSMTKNVGWTLNTGCGSFGETSSSTQFKNGSLHMCTVFYDLSGSCLQPAPGDGPNVIQVFSAYGTFEMKVMPSGKAKSQLIVNPNQPTP